MEIDINDMGSIGAVADMPPYMLPPEAWTQAVNMRSRDGGLERPLGWSSVFGTPTVAPHFIMPAMTTAVAYWMYTSLTKAYVYDGSTHTNITRQSAGVDVNYTATNGYDWNGTNLGGIPILNNGADVPQFWSPISVATKLANLTNWTATTRAKVIRSFGPFLVAFNVTDAGVSRPHLIRWSHPADPGSVPSSWDTADPTKDAGDTELSDVNSGVIHDALPLGSIMYVYKENAVHKMRFVGGRKIMDFGDAAWLPTIGILAPRCVGVTGDGRKHVFASRDDLLWHDGNQVRSILTRRQKRRLGGDMDSQAFQSSFIFANPLYNEMIFCYPGTGLSFPDRGFFLQYGDGDDFCITEIDGITFRHAAAGPIENPATELWSDNPSEVWSDETGPWAQQDRYRVVLAGTADTLLFKLDEGTSRNGTGFISTLQREGLSIIGRNRRTGEWIVDHHAMKLFQRLWPKLQGSPVSVRIGVQQTVKGAVTWSDVTTFDPATDVTADILPMQGRAISLEIKWAAGTSGRIDGYKLELEPVSEF